MVGIQIQIRKVIQSFVHWNVLNKQADYRVKDVSKQQSHGPWGSRYVEQFLDKSGDSGHLCTLLLDQSGDLEHLCTLLMDQSGDLEHLSTLLLDQSGDSDHLCTLFLEQSGESAHHYTVLLAFISVTYPAQDL